MRRLALALIAALGTQTALAQMPRATEERPAAFVDAATLVPGLIADMRYAGAHNFVGRCL
jgi:D-alanyl-D-alanine dipeptidase